MDFPIVRAPTDELSEEHAKAIIHRANEIGRHSIALAQALQFELALHQKDVIGEWIPITDVGSGTSDIVFEGKKWLRGIRWEDIDRDFVLRHTTSQGSRRINEELHRYPLLKRELMAKAARDGERPLSGPVIVCETTQRPWIANEFRRWWRKNCRRRRRKEICEEFREQEKERAREKEPSGSVDSWRCGRCPVEVTRGEDVPHYCCRPERRPGSTSSVNFAPIRPRVDGADRAAGRAHQSARY